MKEKILTIVTQPDCPPCKQAIKTISSLMYNLGINIDIYDLGPRETRVEKLKELGRLGYPLIKSTPSYFIDKKLQERPANLENETVYNWLKTIFK